MKDLIYKSVLLLSLSLSVQAKSHWNTDPMMVSGGCDGMEYSEVLSFMANYVDTKYPADKKLASEKMLADYSIAAALVNRAQECLAEALQLKDLADRLRREQALLSGGTSLSRKQIKRQRKLTMEANAEIQLAARGVEKLSPAMKQSFAQGTAAYLSGTYVTTQLYRGIDDYVKVAKDKMGGTKSSHDKSTFDSVVDVFKDFPARIGFGKSALTVMRGLHNHTLDLINTSRFLQAYSEQKAVKLPNDATKQLASVSDWG